MCWLEGHSIAYEPVERERVVLLMTARALPSTHISPRASASGLPRKTTSARHYTQTRHIHQVECKTRAVISSTTIPALHTLISSNITWEKNIYITLSMPNFIHVCRDSLRSVGPGSLLHLYRIGVSPYSDSHSVTPCTLLQQTAWASASRRGHHSRAQPTQKAAVLSCRSRYFSSFRFIGLYYLFSEFTQSITNISSVRVQTLVV